ncbi:TetR/AcrR family transcriptional regulator [Abyssisolibacter fermentans]|uniref:TetR/AcrR family transcriptional regulator n=1 Tax=Abyssisolibacter fermentans TaxID=1766203 RepID=UPI00082A438E|nr:TetR/AcrR family transcriptional regulator [Abyssisolibacter fermentans]
MSRIIENPRELILSEAKKILYNEAYSSISIRRIAKECNIAVGTIYNYFPTKKELIIEMMTDFWEEYFYNIESIISSEEDFYAKLKKIFDKLSEFIKRFRKVWLSNGIHSSPDYIESGLEKQDIYINKLITIIEELLKKEVNFHRDKSVKKLDIHKLASFIVMNFISMMQMAYVDYKFFENLLKELIK